MSSIMFLFSTLSWILGVPFFEGVYAMLRPAIEQHIKKHILCRGWWIFLSLLVLSQGAPGLLQFLAIILPLCLSHIQLATSKDTVIPLREVLLNIPAAVRLAFQKIKPFLR